MSEHTPNTSGRGKYSKIIRGLYEAIATLETQCDRSLDERDAKIDALVKVLKLIEYASRKDSLTENERLHSVRTIVCGVLSELNGDVGGSLDPK